MTQKYILKGKKAIPCHDTIIEWAQWWSNANRVVKQTEVAPSVTVSTVFLGLDHQFGDGDPLLFETLVIGGHRNGEMDRYSTWDEAVREHDRIVAEFHQHCAHCETLRNQDEKKCSSCGASF